ncbi:MAG TPA: DUF3052 domain-containing protein [Capillimicrobium sp.]|nr:DUF3052 domain-containing protein [Capillimicrobium sp.]
MSGAAAAGYSGTPLHRKLGLKPGQRVLFEQAPAGDWVDVPEGATVLRRPGRDLDLVVTFVTSASRLRARLRALRPRLAQDGALWVAWPKRSSGVPTDVTEDVVRDVALEGDLVDVKVCAIDETWSGLKLVIRTEARR